MTYSVWSAMIQRCTNPKNVQWADYGGRGITVCDRWRSFERFLEDMGEKPAGLSLDRKDNALLVDSYSKANCRWATRIEQNQNKRPRRKYKLTREDANDVRALVGFGFTRQEVAKAFDVSLPNVHMIISGKIWKEVGCG